MVLSDTEDTEGSLGNNPAMKSDQILGSHGQYKIYCISSDEIDPALERK